MPVVLVTPSIHSALLECALDGCDGSVDWHSPPCGTVVDGGVTSVFHRLAEFYVVPTKPPAGATAMPTRYVVVKDDLQLRCACGLCCVPLLRHSKSSSIL